MPPIPAIALIIPARNEAEALPGLLADIGEVLPEADIYLVDDHSSDATARCAEAFPHVTVLRAPIGLGIGASVQLGLRCALKRGYGRYLRLDGDGQHAAADLPTLLARIRPGVLVQGSRDPAFFAGTSSRFRQWGSAYFRFLFRLFTRRNLTDPTSGFMGFDQSIARKFAEFYPTDFPEIESLVLLLRSGHEIESAMVSMRPRASGKSSLDAFSGLVYVLSVTLAFGASFLRRNPYAHARLA